MNQTLSSKKEVSAKKDFTTIIDVVLVKRQLTEYVNRLTTVWGDVYLCSSFFDHLQLALVDLDAPEKAIKKPQEDPTCQPEGKYVLTCSVCLKIPSLSSC